MTIEVDVNRRNPMKADLCVLGKQNETIINLSPRFVSFKLTFYPQSDFIDIYRSNQDRSYENGVQLLILSIYRVFPIY